MIDFKEISHRGDYWELFARDFFREMGFGIETPPDRGPDGGKDMLISENISGTTYKGNLWWLVSCKHFAKSGKSVKEIGEQNILERIKSFKADGFIGFYSTVLSGGLNTRLRQLRDEKYIKEYQIFDHKLIESYLITGGFSELVMRYFPKSYRKIKPLHLVTDKYEPLVCDYCGKDLLRALFKEDYTALISIASQWDSEKKIQLIKDVYCACKGKCDRVLQSRARDQGYLTGWLDISDLVIPVEFLRKLFSIMNRIRQGIDVWDDKAYDKMKSVLISLAQKALRFTTGEERQRVLELLKIPF
jgi:hypothetical protein